MDSISEKESIALKGELIETNFKISNHYKYYPGTNRYFSNIPCSLFFSGKLCYINGQFPVDFLAENYSARADDYSCNFKRKNHSKQNKLQNQPPFYGGNLPSMVNKMNSCNLFK